METHISLLLFILSFTATGVSARTLEELVKAEEGVSFGECLLSPKPLLKGTRIVSVIPARFHDPSSWVTRTILLVGVGEKNEVTDTLELTVPEDLSPKEVISISCNGPLLQIELPGEKDPLTLTYVLDGKKLVSKKSAAAKKS